MFKLVVLCALLAAAVAKPDVLLTSGLPYSTVVSPGLTTIASQASNVVHPSPILYSAPWAYSHLIKKRSPQWPVNYIAPTSYLSTSPLVGTTYTAPLLQSTPYISSALPVTHLIKKRSPQWPLGYIAPTSYVSTNPLVRTAYTAPLLHSTPYISSALPVTHLIKKRSAPLLPVSYAAPVSVSSPLIASTYSATTPLISSTHLYSSPLISEPLSYTTHFIKKRSASVLSPYYVPTSYSQQSRFDLTSSPAVTTYTTQYAYPGVTTHVL